MSKIYCVDPLGDIKQVIRTTSLQSSLAAVPPGLIPIESTPDGDSWWDFENSVWVVKPPKPGPSYRWSSEGKEWSDPRTLGEAKASKNAEIDAAREGANASYFTFAGKQIQVDKVGKEDIAGVTQEVSLTGALPAAFPGGWKAMNGQGFVAIPDVATWTTFVQAMVAQGAANFAHSQALKATLAAATTLEEVDAISWSPT